MKITNYRKIDEYFCTRCETRRFTPMIYETGVCCLCSWEIFKQKYGWD